MTSTKPLTAMARTTAAKKTASVSTKTLSAKTSNQPQKPKTMPAAAPKAEKKKDKPEKVKVVRDSFTIPKGEYSQISALKERGLKLGLEVKKSELIRAGLMLLTSASDAALRKALANVPTLKTGRPGKS